MAKAWDFNTSQVNNISRKGVRMKLVSDNGSTDWLDLSPAQVNEIIKIVKGDSPSV